MKKIIVNHPIHDTEMELFIGKVQGKKKFIISIPEESFSMEVHDEKVDWGWSNLFADKEAREKIGQVIEKEISQW